MAMPQFSVGDTVRCRDEGDDEWLTGIVVSTGPVVVATDEYDAAERDQGEVEGAQAGARDTSEDAAALGRMESKAQAVVI